MTFDTIIRGGTIATASDTFSCDIGIKDGRITALGADLGSAKEIVDATGKLVLPGGIANPDFLRTDPDAVRFVRSFFTAGKPVAAICHGPWTLVEAGVVDGRTLTSWPSLRTDLANAGATWVDEQVQVCDHARARREIYPSVPSRQAHLTGRGCDASRVRVDYGPTRRANHWDPDMGGTA